MELGGGHGRFLPRGGLGPQASWAQAQLVILLLLFHWHELCHTTFITRLSLPAGEAVQHSLAQCCEKGEEDCDVELAVPAMCVKRENTVILIKKLSSL